MRRTLSKISQGAVQSSCHHHLHHPPVDGKPLIDTRPTVTFLAARYHHPLAGTNYTA